MFIYSALAVSASFDLDQICFWCEAALEGNVAGEKWWVLLVKAAGKTGFLCCHRGMRFLVQIQTVQFGLEPALSGGKVYCEMSAGLLCVASSSFLKIWASWMRQLFFSTESCGISNLLFDLWSLSNILPGCHQVACWEPSGFPYSVV